MNTRERLLVFLTVLMLVFAVAFSVYANAKIKLTFMTHTFKPFNDALAEAIKEYEKLNPNVSIEYSHVPHGDFDTKIQTMFAAGKAPHMMWQYYPNMIRLAENGFLDTPPGPIMEDIIQDVMPTTIEQCSYKGKLYGYPNPFVILPIVNIDLYEEAGVDYPTSYNELLMVQEKLTDRKKLQFGVSLSTSGGGGWLQQHWSPLLWGYGEEYLNETLTRAAFNTAGGVASLEDYKKLAPTDVIPDAFVVGKLGTMINGWYQRAFLEESAPNLRYKALPALKGTVTGEPIANAYYWAWVVNSKRPDVERQAAWEFLQFLASPEMNAKFDAIGHGIARRDSIDRYIDDPWMSVFLDNLPHSRRLPATPDWPEIQREIDIQLERYLVGEISASDALELAERQVNKILGD